MTNDAHPCVDKRVYVFKHTAQKKAERHTKKFGRKMIVYQCPRCGFYHLSKIKVENNG